MSRTLRLPDELEDRLREMKDDLDYSSMAECLRDCLDRQVRLYERFRQSRSTNQTHRPYDFLLWLELLSDGNE
jgi:Arc/MetJ-type ribon-helix-helix transcriptional regulator